MGNKQQQQRRRASSAHTEAPAHPRHHAPATDCGARTLLAPPRMLAAIDATLPAVRPPGPPSVLPSVPPSMPLACMLPSATALDSACDASAAAERASSRQRANVGSGRRGRPSSSAGYVPSISTCGGRGARAGRWVGKWG